MCVIARVEVVIEDYEGGKPCYERICRYGLALEGWEPPAELRERMQGRNRFDMSPDDMAEVLNVDRATFHRYRSGFVYGVAERLGWY